MRKSKKLTRVPDWLEFLKLYVERRADEPFEWGKNDCLHFANGAVKAVTGEDLMAGMELAYSDEAGAMQYLRDHGYKTLRGAVSRKLGKPVHPAQAGKGDIVYKEDDHGKQVGVCVGQWSAFIGEQPYAMLEDGTPLMKPGVVHVPTMSCKLAWKVG